LDLDINPVGEHVRLACETNREGAEGMKAFLIELCWGVAITAALVGGLVSMAVLTFGI
jgi:hypothetical protein